MKVLVTGATGFIGGAFCEHSSRTSATSLRVAVRGDGGRLPSCLDRAVVEGLTPSADWSEAVRGCGAIVHAAARVHVMRDRARDPLAEFRQVNVDGTLNLARQAAAAGVRRFLFISSIKVHGEATSPGRPFTADDKPAPADAYGVSKREAEDGLRQVAHESGMELVIIRPPLVYGPGVKGNFASMMRWMLAGLPLPLGAVHNKRSLVGLDNLVDLIATCLVHPAAANQTFLAGDGKDLSTTELLRRIAAALGRPARLLPVPASLLERAAGLLGQRHVAQRLCSSLQVDITKATTLLSWRPPVGVDEGLSRTARHFLGAQDR